MRRMPISLGGLLLLGALLELWVLIEVGRWLGAGWTVLLVIGTAVLGASLARREGLRAMSDLMREVSANSVPSEAVAEVILVFFAAVLLMLPGFITDFIGLLLLFPMIRGGMVRRWWGSMAAKMPRPPQKPVDSQQPPGAGRIYEQRFDEQDPDNTEQK